MGFSLSAYLDSVYSMDGRLIGDARKRRQLLMMITMVVTITGVLVALVGVDDTNRELLDASVVCMTLPSFICFCMIIAKRHVSETLLKWCVSISGIGVLLGDLFARGMGLENWPVFVAVIDFMLVMRVETRFTTAVVITVVIWLLVCTAESMLRVGLFDIPGTMPQSSRMKRWVQDGSCDTLPCPTSKTATLTTAIGSVSVFVIDYVATRGFAEQVLKEQAEMMSTISTVEVITQQLARYDVDAVAEMLEAKRTVLPKMMHATLEQMEQNLRAYKPYLPAALFEMEELSEDSFLDCPLVSNVVPPGVKTEVATMVFTDIRSSTSIWEDSPNGMRAGLCIHNNVIREAMAEFSGYEVKTIGDAFMTAFATTVDGMNFAMRVHEGLREAEWPSALLEVPICAEQGKLWGGLTVRIGVNSGPVAIEQNTLTGRMDYFGNTVNVASRLEGTCHPGAIAIPEEIWEPNERDALPNFTSAPENVILAGVAGTVFIYNVWPMSLAGRKTCPLQPNNRRRADTCGSSEVSSCVSFCINKKQERDTLKNATVGVLELRTGENMDAHTLRLLSMGIGTLTAPLDQTGGSLVSLFGNCACVGWNLLRAVAAHAEVAVHYVNRLARIGNTFASAGLVSGVVHHGDVGTRTHRFVALVGPAVHRSWTLREEAKRNHIHCLYEPPPDTLLPSSIMELLSDSHRPGIFKLKEELGPESGQFVH